LITALNSSTVGLGLATVATNLFFTFTTSLPSSPSRESIASLSSIASIASLASVARVDLRQAEVSQDSTPDIPSAATQASQAATATNPDSVGSRASRASVASIASVASRASLAAVFSAPSVGTVASVASIAAVGSVNSIAAVPFVTTPGVNQALIDSRRTIVTNALFKVRADQQVFGTNSAVLSIRADFTKSYTQILKAGSEALTLADLNEEGANLTALQTRQQLGVVSLSITVQSEQSILRLF
jgi:flagellin-like hook-associated protein FlgL